MIPHIEGPLTIAWMESALRHPARLVTFIARGTFALLPGGPCPPVEKPELPSGDLHLDDDPERALVYPSDFAPFKPRTDLILVGSAYAPGGRRVRALPVTFGVGAWRKSLTVVGDRRMGEGVLGRVSEPGLFSVMPLTLERAYGGPRHAANPLGCGAFGERDTTGQRVRRLPNIETSESVRDSPLAPRPPAGFGPLPLTYPQRMQKAGTYSGDYATTRWPALPLDFDAGLYNAAPEDQQLPAPLRGDEALFLENLRPDVPDFRASLPGLRVRCFYAPLHGSYPRPNEVPMTLDTLVVDTDKGTLSLVWRGAVEFTSAGPADEDPVLLVVEPLAEPPRAVEAYRDRLRRLYGAPPPAAVPPAPAAESPPAGAEPVPPAAEVPVANAAPPAPMQPGEGPAAAAALSAPSAEPLASPPPLPAPAPAARARVEAALARGESLRGLELAGADLAGSSLAGADFTGAVLTGTNLRGADLSGACLRGALLSGADLSDARLVGADLEGAELADATLTRADLAGARLADAVFSRARLQGACLAGAQAPRAFFDAARLGGADFSGAGLIEAVLGGARMPRAGFARADLTRANLERAWGGGVSFRHANLTEVRAARSNLRGADFAAACAPKSVWQGAMLAQAVFDEADFRGAEFEGADLSDCRCLATEFRTARFVGITGRRLLARQCGLFRVNFEQADLRGATFSGSNLFESTFMEARAEGAHFDDCNLGRAIGPVAR